MDAVLPPDWPLPAVAKDPAYTYVFQYDTAVNASSLEFYYMPLTQKSMYGQGAHGYTPPAGRC
jgi:hypothetical protein